MRKGRALETIKQIGDTTMAKITPKKSNKKAGGELNYGNAENIVGGPICNDPISSLNPSKPVKGSKQLPPVKK